MEKVRHSPNYSIEAKGHHAILSKYFASAPSVVEMYMHQEEITQLRTLYTYYYGSYYIDKKEFIKEVESISVEYGHA